MKPRAIMNFEQLAKKQGRKILNIPLNSGESAKVVFNDEFCDIYVVKDGNVLKKIKSSRSKFDLDTFLARQIQKFQKLAVEGVDVLKEYTKSCYRLRG